MEKEEQLDGLASPMKKMASIKAKINLTKAALSTLNEQYKSMQKQALANMESGGVKNIKFEMPTGEIFTAFQAGRVRAKVIDPEAFDAWCKENGHGDSNGFKMWSAQKVQACVRELLQDEEASLPQGVEVNEFQEVRLRKD
jgi:hypothetical protein